MKDELENLTYFVECLFKERARVEQLLPFPLRFIPVIAECLKDIDEILQSLQETTNAINGLYDSVKEIGSDGDGN